MQRNGVRAAAIVAGALVFLVLAGAIVYRVLAPAEVVTEARVAYPAPVPRSTGVIGTLSAAPLIVDGRLRVYATTRQVRAEEPADAETRRTPYWSYRRWPAQLNGLLAVDRTVVSRWSDGRLVALDATTGRVAWRADGPRPNAGYDGRLTGASTMYAPDGLLRADTSGGRTVLIVASAADLRGLDLRTGRELWRVAVGNSCRSTAFTTTAGLLVAVDTCATPRTVEFRDADTGTPVARWRPTEPMTEVAPVGCASGRSACAAMRTTGGGSARGWLLDGARPEPARTLDRPSAWLVGDVAVTGAGDGVTARSARTGKELWHRGGGGYVRVLAVQYDRVHLLTDSQELITLAAATGTELSRFVLEYGREGTGWSPGWAYAADGYVAVERLTRPVRPDSTDREYYITGQPVIFAGT
ncbi:MAG TPA: PQQ-binding-like beta-propeller repeat protein [Micromonosporaceae bacterium]